MRSGAKATRPRGPNTWQWASTVTGGSPKAGLDGLGHQSSQSGLLGEGASCESPRGRPRSEGPEDVRAAAVRRVPDRGGGESGSVDGGAGAVRTLAGGYVWCPAGDVCGSVEVAEPGGLERFAHSVHVEAEFPRGEPPPFARFVGLPRRAASVTAVSRSAGTTTTPSASAATTSPGRTTALAHTTGMLTDPRVALTVPLELTARLNTGKSISRSVSASRQPPSMTRPTAPCARIEVASRSPKNPSSHSVVQAATRTSPGLSCSAATCNIQLSPGWRSTVTAVPQNLAPG